MPAPRCIRRSVRHVVDYHGALPPWATLAVLFIASGWLRAGAEKLVDPQWWTGATLEQFLVDHAGAELALYSPFTDSVVAPAAVAVAWFVAAVQVLVGISLLVGWSPRVALVAGMALNVQFVLAGAVNPSAFYLVIQGALLVWSIDQLPARQRERAWGWLTPVAVGLFFLCVPFIGTLHPADAIDDPALMLCFLAVLVVVADAAGRRPTRSRRAAPADLAGAGAVSRSGSWPTR